MAISKPIVVYNAENNVEAQMLCNHLEQNGIEAYVTFDESAVGLSAFGALPEIHKPQIWIDEPNVPAATPLFAEYERERARRSRTRDSTAADASAMNITCEDCGKTSSFPASKHGTTQDCSHCGAYVDVEEAGAAEENWGEPE